MTQDETKFHQLYAQTKVPVHGYVLRRANTAEDAEDVLAEVYTTAWRRIREVPPGSQTKLWLFGVARRTLSNQKRSLTRRNRLAAKALFEFRNVDFSFEDQSATTMHVRSAVQTLDEENREILHLSIWEGLTAAEIATVLDMKASTVRSKLHRTRNQLKQTLADDSQRSTKTRT